MMHLCPPAISASEDFDALGDLEDKLAACPAAIFGTAASADSSAPFLMRMRGSEQAAIGGPKLVGASYVFEDVPGGEASIIPAFEPAGSRFGALEFERGGEALVSYGGGIVNLDTRLAGADGISVHVFNFTGGEVRAY